MRHLGTFITLLAATFWIVGCGGGGSSPNLTGNWQGTTTSSVGGNGNFPVSFTFSMQEGTLNGNAAPVTITNLLFITVNNCFGSGATASATVTQGNPRTLTGDVYSGANNTGNHLTFSMQVTGDNNSASGMYNMAGGNGACAAQDSGTIDFARQ